MFSEFLWLFTIDKLPQELWILIFKYISHRDLLKTILNMCSYKKEYVHLLEKERFNELCVKWIEAIKHVHTTFDTTYFDTTTFDIALMSKCKIENVILTSKFINHEYNVEEPALCSTLFKESSNINTLLIRNVYYNKHDVIECSSMKFLLCFISDIKCLVKNITSLKIENIESTRCFWEILKHADMCTENLQELKVWNTYIDTRILRDLLRKLSIGKPITSFKYFRITKTIKISLYITALTRIINVIKENIEILDLRACEIFNIDIFAECNKLTYLNISNSHILETLSDVPFPNLKTLVIKKCLILPRSEIIAFKGINPQCNIVE